jgi:hypothetical protein
MADTEFNENNPWFLPSTSVGNAFDDLSRDMLKMKKVTDEHGVRYESDFDFSKIDYSKYPLLSETLVNNFAK